MSRHHAKLDQRRWARVRRLVLERDGGRCQVCGRLGWPLEVDHVKPVAEGGAEYDLGNLQSICRSPCHFEKTRRERAKPETPETEAWRKLLTDLVARD